MDLHNLFCASKYPAIPYYAMPRNAAYAAMFATAKDRLQGYEKEIGYAWDKNLGTRSDRRGLLVVIKQDFEKYLKEQK